MLGCVLRIPGYSANEVVGFLDAVHKLRGKAGWTEADWQREVVTASPVLLAAEFGIQVTMTLAEMSTLAPRIKGVKHPLQNECPQASLGIHGAERFLTNASH